MIQQGKTEVDRQAPAAREAGMHTWHEVAAGVAVLALAAFFRLYRIDALPPGLYVDEAHNGLDALRILDGARPIYLTANQGREPLYSYLQALFCGLFGPTTLSLRLTSVFIGLATVAATYVFVRSLPLRSAARVGLLTGTVMALTFWHVHYSRYGIRAILVPLLALLACTFFWRGLMANSRRQVADRSLAIRYWLSAISFWLFAMAGIFLAAGAYTHPSGRLVPLILIGFTVYRAVADRRHAWRAVTGLVLAGLVAAILFLPLARYYAQHPEAFTKHTAQVSIFGNEFVEGSPARTLVLNVLRVAGMFVWRGDLAWNQNLAGRPVFDPVMAAFFLAGVIWLVAALVRPRLDPRERDVAVFMGLWLGVMLSASIFSGNAPHFTRAIGALPAIVFLPAIALDRAWAWLDVRRATMPVLRDRWAGALIAAIVAVSGIWTYHDYFDVYANRPEIYQAWDGEQVDMARYLNSVAPDHQIYLLSAFLRHAPMRFLTREWTRSSLRATEGLVLPGQQIGRDVLYVLVPWEKEEVAAVANLLGPVADRQEITGSQGQPLLTIFRLPVSRLPDSDGRLPPPLAPQHPTRIQFGGQIELLGFNDEREIVAGDYPTLTLYWRRLQPLRENYTMFAHVVDATGTLWGQHDKEPLATGYPTGAWEAGDIVIDRLRPVISTCAPPGIYRLRVGIYERQSGQHLPVANTGSRQVELGALTVLPGKGLDLDEVQPQHPVTADLSPSLSLLGYDAGPAAASGQGLGELRPGDPLTLNLYWHVRAPLAGNTMFALRLRAADERLEELWRGMPQTSTATWPPGRAICDHRPLRLPPSLPAGRYTVEVAQDEAVAVLGELTVLDQARQFTSPNPQHLLRADLGDSIRLVGYDLAGLQLTLYWQARGPTKQPYTVFVHLLDSGGRVRAQQDNQPVAGRRPTTGWATGEYIADPYTLSLPPDAGPGPYQVEIGMYDPATGTRLPAFDTHGQRLAGDRIFLSRLEVQPATEP